MVPMPHRPATGGVLLLALVVVGASWRHGQAPQPSNPELEVFPRHFLLHPGEEIHYQVQVREGDRFQSVPHYEFAIEAPGIVRSIEPNGELFIEAVRSGRTHIVVRTPTSERRLTIDVAGSAQRPIMAVPYSTTKEIKAKEFLFIGHANLDGFDHTAVAKPGIDRLVEQARQDRRPVVYWVSQEYPDWYTADRRPDYAFITEGQEHQIHVDARRVTFAGGDFMFCLLRNAQMTLHGMVSHDARRVEFVFPAQAIWAADIWGPDAKRPYPAPMVLLNTFFSRRANDAQAYNDVVVPFLDRLTMGLPVGGYPPDFPAPLMNDLLKDWGIVVRFGAASSGSTDTPIRTRPCSSSSRASEPGAAQLVVIRVPLWATSGRRRFDRIGPLT